MSDSAVRNSAVAVATWAVRAAAVGCWGLTVAGIAGYSWVFFGRKQLGASAAVAGGMMATAAGMVAASSHVDKPAALANVPLLAWLGFAGLISEELVRRN